MFEWFLTAAKKGHIIPLMVSTTGEEGVHMHRWLAKFRGCRITDSNIREEDGIFGSGGVCRSNSLLWQILKPYSVSDMFIALSWAHFGGKSIFLNVFSEIVHAREKFELGFDFLRHYLGTKSYQKWSHSTDFCYKSLHLGTRESHLAERFWNFSD